MPEAQPAQRAWNWGGLEVALLLTVLGFAVYAPALSAPFIFDDDRTISLNPHVRQLLPADWLTKETRPFAMLTFALNYHFAGLNLTVLHVTNVAIHIAAAWLLFLLVREVLAQKLGDARAKTLALVASLIWLVHPLNTQAVTYLSQRFESLMGFFFLATLYCLARAARGSQIGWGIAAIVAAWLGACCKEVMIVVVALAPLFDRAYLADSWRSALRQRGWIHACLAPIAVFLLLPHGGDNSAGFGLESVTPWEYLRSQPNVILHYLGTAVLPRRLVFDYAWPIEHDPFRIFGLGLIVVSLAAAAVAMYVRKPAWGFPALAFFVLLAPTSSILPIADLAVEHRMYLSTAALVVGGVALAFAWLQRIENASQRTWIATGLATALVVILAGRTYLRNDDYRRPLRLYLQCVAFNAQNRRANNNVAVILQSQQRLGEAKLFYEAAIKADPKHGYAYRQLGMIAVDNGKLEEAVDWFAKSITAEPRELNGHYYLGLTLQRLGRDREAKAAFDDALKLSPQFAPAMRENAWLLATTADEELRDGAAALAFAERAAQTRPNDPRVLSAKAAALAVLERWEEAVETSLQAEKAAEEQKRKDLADFGAYVATFRRGELFLRTPAKEAVQ